MMFGGEKAIMAVIVIASAMLTDGADTRPSRAECITGILLDWSPVPENNIWETRSKMFDYFLDEELVGKVSAQVISKDGLRVYIQYSEDCDMKIWMTQKIIQEWQDTIDFVPSIEIIDGIIQPSIDTIDVRGENWRD